jgi:putative methanogenesis marker protein 2
MTTMDLAGIATTIRNYEGVRRKRHIGSAISAFKDTGKMSENVLADFGEDAAVVERGDGHVLLMASDGIWGRLLEADPWWAGYCAVLVNVNDIIAMGARPLCMVDVLSLSSKVFCHDVGRGLSDGISKFGVPLLGGHIHPDTEYDALNIAILGEAEKDALIYSHTARPGDRIVAAVDMDGRLYPNFDLNWDTTTHKNPERIREMMGIMEDVGKKALATAGKDISNPGMIGTLGMLSESSGVGGTVDLTRVPIPTGIEMSHWLKVYPGYGFVMTAAPEKAPLLIEEFEKKGVAAADVGGVDDTMKIRISDSKREEMVFDLEAEPIMGIGKHL